MLTSSDIDLPRGLGEVTHTYLSPAGRPLICYVQDGPMNFEAQKKVAGILEYLIGHCGLALVLLEGKLEGSCADFKYLREQYTPEVRQRGADDLLKRGVFSAVNYVDLTSEYEFAVVGIEDRAFYAAQTEYHVGILTQREQITATIESLQRAASQLQAEAAPGKRQKLALIQRWLALLLLGVNVRLVPDEYAYWVQHKAEMDLPGWVGFLETELRSRRCCCPLPHRRSLRALFRMVDLVDRFYRIAVYRRRVFIQNIEEIVERYGKDEAILIACGFHTPRMTQLMREKGFSYVVITPRLDELADPSAEQRSLERARIDLESLKSRQCHGGKLPHRT